VISVYILFANLYGGSINPENQVDLSNDQDSA
jgi:triosephosphate isomerase